MPAGAPSCDDPLVTPDETAIDVLDGGGPTDASDERMRAHLRWLGTLPAEQRRLRRCDSVGDLLAETGALALEVSAYRRALVLGVGPSSLTAGESSPLRDPDSDALRRRILAAPVELVPGTLEHDVVRGGGAPPRRARTSRLATQLDLDRPVLAPIAPDGPVIALLVADRPQGSPDPLTRATVLGTAVMVGVALEHLIVEARMHEAFASFRYLASSTQAVMDEVLQAPVSLPRSGEAARLPLGQELGAFAGEPEVVLTRREEEVAAQLLEGRSNREIAEELFISVETVKDSILRVRRKLGATNRVEAAARYRDLTRRRGLDLGGF